MQTPPKNKRTKNKLNDYAELDDDVNAFIAVSASFQTQQPTHLNNQSVIAHQRACYNALCAHFHHGRPDGITVDDRLINGVPTRHYTSNKSAPPHNIDFPHIVDFPQIVYFHGGGFVVGNLDTHDDATAAIADRTGFALTAVDYRLAPEHLAPAALDDCRAVLSHILAHTTQPVIVAGDSAGGYLAAMLALEFGPKIAGQVLLYPMLGGRMDQGSYLDHAHAPMLTTDQVQYYWETYFGVAIPRDGEMLPLSASDHRHLPPAVIIAAGCDPLYSDAVQYAEKLQSAGVAATLITEDGLPHGYIRARHSTNRAAASFDRIIEGFKSLT